MRGLSGEVAQAVIGLYSDRVDTGLRIFLALICAAIGAAAAVIYVQVRHWRRRRRARLELLRLILDKRGVQWEPWEDEAALAAKLRAVQLADRIRDEHRGKPHWSTRVRDPRLD